MFLWGAYIPIKFVDKIQNSDTFGWRVFVAKAYIKKFNLIHINFPISILYKSSIYQLTYHTVRRNDKL